MYVTFEEKMAGEINSNVEKWNFGTQSVEAWTQLLN